MNEETTSVMTKWRQARRFGAGPIVARTDGKTPFPPCEGGIQGGERLPAARHDSACSPPPLPPLLKGGKFICAIEAKPDGQTPLPPCELRIALTSVEFTFSISERQIQRGVLLLAVFLTPTNTVWTGRAHARGWRLRPSEPTPSRAWSPARRFGLSRLPELREER